MEQYNLTLRDIQTRLIHLLEMSRLNSLNSNKIDEILNLTNLQPPRGDVDIDEIKTTLIKQICSVIFLSWHFNIDVNQAVDDYLNNFEQNHYMAT